MRVLMLPSSQDFSKSESGIRRVIEAYEKYGPAAGIEYVRQDATSYDIKATHAGATGADPDVTVAHIHGLYWTADLDCANWEYTVNAGIVNTLRYAKVVTAPSDWVAETVRRDMRRPCHVLPHGIDWQAWQHDEECGGYVLWNKNRASDVCSPDVMWRLAYNAPTVPFVSTFAPAKPLSNLHVTGMLPHAHMRRVIQACKVYLSTSKETFCLGALEAMAAGKPVLAFAQGNVANLVQHGVNGYLAKAGDEQDLEQGLYYCLQYADILGENGRFMAQEYTWPRALEKVAQVYHLAMAQDDETVSVVIPCYNYRDKVGRAIESALRQTYPVKEVVVVDDGSSDGSSEVVKEWEQKDSRVKLMRQNNMGVAHARNNGIWASEAKYIVCLDADDAIAPNFVEACVKPMKQDRSLGITYTGLYYIRPEGAEGLSPWPGDWDFNEQIKGHNQVPTCCLMRKEMLVQLGGYRQRYAPWGAGAEDGELWLRCGAYGWRAKKVHADGLFIYSWGSGRVSSDLKNPAWNVNMWLDWHPWTKDGQHPFASYAAPKRQSHPVRQYDEPVVSVVIPVGPNHTGLVLNALDSLDAQTFRKWEAIVVWDGLGEGNEQTRYIEQTFPHVRYVSLRERHGAGYARNRGAEIARAPFLLFLDADDWLYPEFLHKTLMAYSQTGEAVYTGYVGLVATDEAGAQQLEAEGRLAHWDARTQTAITKHKAIDFDCAKAMQEPQGWPMYIWCNITTLHPKSWWQENGGFDEDMESWEDWDYWLRLVRTGHCFRPVNEELMVYSFSTGSRRDWAHKTDDSGRQNAQSLIQYIRMKYDKESSVVGCASCGKKASSPVYNRDVPVSATAVATTQKGLNTIVDSDMKLCRYWSPNAGDHRVNSPSGAIPGGYGYRTRGEVFYVHVRDISMHPDRFSVVQEIPQAQAQVVVTPPPVMMPVPPPPPQEVTPEQAIERLARVKDEARKKAEADTQAMMNELRKTVPTAAEIEQAEEVKVVQVGEPKKKRGRPKKVQTLEPEPKYTTNHQADVPVEWRMADGSVRQG